MEKMQHPNEIISSRKPKNSLKFQLLAAQTKICGPGHSLTTSTGH
jgi:hypothetical protein